MMNVDLDLFEPKRITSNIKYAKELRNFRGRKTNLSTKLTMTAHRIFTQFNSRGKEDVGIEPSKLLDWRHIESRMNYVREKHSKHSAAMWSGLKSMLEQSKADALCILEEGGEQALEYARDGLMHRNVDQIIERARQNPKYKLCTISGDEAKAFHRAYTYDYALLRRHGTYRRAFEWAVEDRVKTYMEKVLYKKSSRYALYDTACFILTNEGREYVITTDYNGIIKWISAKVIRCT